MNKIESTEDLVEFLMLLSEDYKNNQKDWENTTVDEFIEAIAGFIEDNSSGTSLNPIKWNKEMLSTVAKLFYMGKIYE